MSDRRTKSEIVAANIKLAAENARLRELLAGRRFDAQTRSSFRARCEAARNEALRTGKVVSVS